MYRSLCVTHNVSLIDGATSHFCQSCEIVTKPRPKNLFLIDIASSRPKQRIIWKIVMRWNLSYLLLCRSPAIRSSVAFGGVASHKSLVRAFMSSSRSSSITDIQEDHPMKRCHLNHAGASPSPSSVTDRVCRHLELEQIQGGYTAAAMVEKEVNQVYQAVADLIHAVPSEIALVESATVAWTRAFYTFAEHQEREMKGEKNPVILISDVEYAANVVAACQWARDKKWTVLSIPSVAVEGKSTGIVDLVALEEILSGRYLYANDEGDAILLDPSRIAIACITHVPTNSGIVNPVVEIGDRIAEFNARQQQQILYLVDACQSVGQLVVNAHEIQCHALVATGRKYLRGPRGTGFLFVSSSIVNQMIPSHIDHYGVLVSDVPDVYQDGDVVQNCLEFAPREGAARFEFWESNVANRLGLGVAITEATRKGTFTIEKNCTRLAKSLRAQLEGIPSIVIHHKSSSSCGIVTFYSNTLGSSRIKEKMLTEGFELSVVPATSTPLDSSKLKVPDLVRASLSYTNTEDEVVAFSRALRNVLEKI